MTAIDDLTALLETTEAVKHVLEILKKEPAYLLSNICQEYEKVKEPVPDYRLQITGYLAETALNALVSAKLITRQSGERMSLYTYEPTTEGQKQYERLKASGFYHK